MGPLSKMLGCGRPARCCHPLRTILRGPSAYGFGAIRRWRKYLREKDVDDAVFGFWHRMFDVAKGRFTIELQTQLKSDSELNPILRDQILRDEPKSMVELARCYGAVLEEIYKEHSKGKGEEFRDDSAKHELWLVLFGKDSAPVMSPLEAIDCFSLNEHVEYRKLLGEVERVATRYEQIPGRAMMMLDRTCARLAY